MMINAGMGVYSVTILPVFLDERGFFAPRVDIRFLLLSLGTGAIGYGLLKRKSWARWWSLGGFFLAPLGVLLGIALGFMALGASELTGDAARTANTFARSVSPNQTAAGWLWTSAILVFITSAL